MSSPTTYRRPPRARVARFLDSVLPVLGVAVVLSAVALGGGGWGLIWMAVVGLLMVEAGVWRLGSRMMNERRYLPLREEVQRFIGLARELNRRSAPLARPDAASARDEGLKETIAALHDSLDRMVSVAGKTQEEVEAAGSSMDVPPARIEA